LKEHREKLARRVEKTKQVSEDVIVRGNLKKGFDANYIKYTENAAQIRTHNDFLNKRLKAFMVSSECFDIRLGYFFYQINNIQAL